jgi:hypothetical protein
VVSTVEPPTPTPVTLIDPSLLPSEALVEQLDDIPVGQHVVLVLHEDHFAQALATYLATKPRAIYRDVDVQFSPAQVKVRGGIRVFGVWVSATVWGNLQAQDCRAKVMITDLSVGGLLTPALVRQEARKLIHSELEKALDDLFKTLPVCLESIEVLDGVAIVEGPRQQLEP